MGAHLHRPRRRGLGASASLALVLALAGSTSPMGRSDAFGEDTLWVAPASDEQPNASVTVADPQRYPAPTETAAPEPAVRIAVTGQPAGTAIQADLADVLLRAYRSAVADSPASCHLPVSLLAAIGQVESGSLVGRPIDAQHRTSVIGPVLDGNGFAAIPDTDHGLWDGDTVWDRAVGPMQFIPSTWRMFGVDGDGDGVANPQDLEDAAAGTAAYLCYGGRDLTDPAALRTALLAYNHSTAYLQLVLTYQQRYADMGLDSGVAVTGLPTSIALSAVPVTGPYGGPAAGPVAGPTVAPTGWEVGAIAAHRKRMHTTTTTTTASALARASGAPTSPPTTAGTPGGGTTTSPSAPGSPTGSDSGSSPGSPPASPPASSSGTPPDPSSGSPSGTPSEPSSGSPSGTPSEPSSGSPSGPAPESPSAPTPPPPTCPTAPTSTSPDAPATDPAGGTGTSCPPADPSTTASTSSAP